MNRVMNYLLAFGLLLALNGCKTLEERCIERFPTQVVTEVRTVRNVDTLILPDAWVEYIDTTICPPGLTDTLVIVKTRTRYLPGDTIVYDYYCTDTVQVVSNPGQLAYLTSETAKLRAQLDDANRRTRMTHWSMLGAGALIIIVLAWLLMRKKK